jgi:hypothetical protein
MPRRVIECEPELHQFVVRNPDVLVSIWDRLGITSLTVDRVSQFVFDTNDGMGTTARVDLVYGSPELHVFLARGQYEGPLLPQPIQGHGVALLRSKLQLSPTGQKLIRDDLDVFVKLDSGPVDLAARTLHPLFIRNADYNFVETANFVARLSAAARESPNGLQRMISQLTRLHPTVQQGFSQVTRDIADSRADLPESPRVWTARPVQHRPSAMEPQAISRYRIPQASARYPVDGPVMR